MFTILFKSSHKASIGATTNTSNSKNVKSVEFSGPKTKYQKIKSQIKNSIPQKFNVPTPQTKKIEVPFMNKTKDSSAKSKAESKKKMFFKVVRTEFRKFKGVRYFKHPQKLFVETAADFFQMNIKMPQPAKAKKAHMSENVRKPLLLSNLTSNSSKIRNNIYVPERQRLNFTVFIKTKISKTKMFMSDLVFDVKLRCYFSTSDTIEPVKPKKVKPSKVKIYSAFNKDDIDRYTRALSSKCTRERLNSMLFNDPSVDPAAICKKCTIAVVCKHCGICDTCNYCVCEQSSQPNPFAIKNPYRTELCFQRTDSWSRSYTPSFTDTFYDATIAKNTEVNSFTTNQTYNSEQEPNQTFNTLEPPNQSTSSRNCSVDAFLTEHFGSHHCQVGYTDADSSDINTNGDLETAKEEDDEKTRFLNADDVIDVESAEIVISGCKNPPKFLRQFLLDFGRDSDEYFEEIFEGEFEFGEEFEFKEEFEISSLEANTGITKQASADTLVDNDVAEVETLKSEEDFTINGCKNPPNFLRQFLLDFGKDLDEEIERMKASETSTGITKKDSAETLVDNTAGIKTSFKCAKPRGEGVNKLVQLFEKNHAKEDTSTEITVTKSASEQTLIDNELDDMRLALSKPLEFKVDSAIIRSAMRQTLHRKEAFTNLDDFINQVNTGVMQQ